MERRILNIDHYLFIFTTYFLSFQKIIPDNPESVPTFGLHRDLVLIVAPVVGGVVIIALIFVGFVICVTAVKKKRSLHGTYSPQKQEFGNAPRFEMTDFMFKIPPEERLI